MKTAASLGLVRHQSHLAQARLGSAAVWLGSVQQQSRSLCSTGLRLGIIRYLLVNRFIRSSAQCVTYFQMSVTCDIARIRPCKSKHLKLLVSKCNLPQCKLEQRTLLQTEDTRNFEDLPQVQCFTLSSSRQTSDCHRRGV